MHRNFVIKLAIVIVASLLLAQPFMGAVQAQEWDFPRLDEILFVIKYPYTVAIEAAKACEIDTYVGAIRTDEVETLKNPPYNWTVTAAPGFHMCYLGVNCRDVTPPESGAYFNYHNRQPGFPLYPLNISQFRYALELMVGCDKDVWIPDIYGYINVRLDTCVPPANVYWYHPGITPYPKDWDAAAEILYAAGFTGTIGGNDWVMPNGVPLNERVGDPATGEYAIYVMAPEEAPTSVEVTRRHVKNWNLFFCGQEVADPPHSCIFKLEVISFYTEIDVAFGNRDHDIYFLCWGLGRFPTYLYWFFHPETDQPYLNNSPGFDYRPLNLMIKAFYECRWFEYFEKQWIGPGPTTVAAGTEVATQYAFEDGTEEIWIGVDHASPNFPWRYLDLQRDVDYEVKTDAEGNGVAIVFLRDIDIPPDYYIHICYDLVNDIPITEMEELRQLCWDIQEILYYSCPYLPIYSRNYHDLYKPGLTCWVPSLGYGSAAYQLKWTYGSIHWEGTPVGGSVRWHLPGPIDTLHPWLAESVYEVTILNRIYDGMMEVDAYTHADIPWIGVKYKILDWTGPNGEPGMIIQWWIRNDVTWQDGDPVTVDDLIWQYDFINSTRPSQLFDVWQYYHGCIKYNDYCFGIKVNATGIWRFYSYTMGPIYPRKIWEPFYGDKEAAEAFKPWEVAYTDYVPPEKQGPTPPPKCLYGTGEWIFDWYNPTLGMVRVYKNTNWWGRLAAQPCRQIPAIHAPTEANYGDMSKVTKTVVGLYTFNLDTKANCTHTWTLKMDGEIIATGEQELKPLEFHNWWEALPWQTVEPGLHTFTLEITNEYGTNVYTIEMAVLIGDVDNNNIVNMLDLYYTALSFGWTGDPCCVPYDINTDGIVNMLDLYICALKFGGTLP